MADIFISYARNDREAVGRLADALEGAGYSVWWDHDLAGGATFAVEIERALKGAKSVIVAWSVKSVQSEWVIDEADIAKREGKLVPIVLDATPPPIGFRQYQSIDFSDWNGSHEAPEIGEVTESINRFTRRQMAGARAVSDDLIEERAHSSYTDALAVLPLENLTGDPEQQFLVDGIHEAVISSLSKIGALKVISRTSSKRYAAVDKSLNEIAAELGVSKIVEGSVIRAENQLRVTVQLIDARSDTHIWGDSFDQTMTNILKLQRDVATAIAEEISVVLTPVEVSRLASAKSVNAEAHEAYLKGMYHWYKLTPEDLQLALEWFDRALAVDPGYAPAWAGIGMAWGGVQQMGAAPSSFTSPKIQSAVDKALECDPGLFQAHFTNAVHQTWSLWNWAEADAAFQRAIELNPNFPDTHAYYSHFLNIVGRFAEAEEAINKALNLDPFNPLVRSLYGIDLIFWRRYDDAIREMNSVRQMAPDHWLALQGLRLPFFHKGMTAELLAANRELFSLLGKLEVVEAIDRAEAEGGIAAAMTATGDALTNLSDRSLVHSTQISVIYNMAGEFEKSVKWAQRAFEEHDPDLPYIKYLYNLREEVMRDERVIAILDQMNYPSLDAG